MSDWERRISICYPYLMDGRWFQEPEDCPQPPFVRLVKPVLANVTESVVEELLSYRNWRYRVVGNWLAGIKERSQYIEIISQSLGGNYCQMTVCFALVCFKSDRQKLIIYPNI